MTEITAFISARLDEDEAAAQECAAMDWSIETTQRRIRGDAYEEVWLDGPGFNVAASVDPASMHPTDADHIARHDPARVLAQVAATRAIVDLHNPGGGHECSETGDHFRYILEDEHCETLRHLAAIWRDHETYDPSWAPDA